MLETFSPDGASAGWFAENYFIAGNPDFSRFEHPRLSADPSHGKLINFFCIRFPDGVDLASGQREPSMVLRDGSDLYALWFHHSVDPARISERSGKPSAHNLYLQVRFKYASLMSGTVVDEFPNPFLTPARWNGHIDTLKAFKDDLRAVDNWGSFLVPEFLSRGGSANTEAQRDARAAFNEWQKTRAGGQAQEIINAVEAGLSNRELSMRFNVKPESVPSMISRARKRLAS
ncbi:hypothetical protein ASH02_24145 [Nocardioides sp. Soil796]|nr:hypothetical protein ASH02_24145 [Nocardioides sp. Soil796]